jgi:hypothetical protein
MSLMHSYTKAVQSYDRELYAGHTKDGVPCIFRRVKRWIPVCEDEGFSLKQLREDKELIFALTDTWAATGTPRLWGIDKVLDRLKEIDAWAHEDVLSKIDEQNSKVDQSRARHLDNEAEAFLKDNRREFVKGFEEIAPMARSLPREEKRKKLRDRRIKNGNY